LCLTLYVKGRGGWFDEEKMASPVNARQLLQETKDGRKFEFSLTRTFLDASAIIKAFILHAETSGLKLHIHTTAISIEKILASSALSSH
jgi:hypothetical protein